jgi:YggT family protein
MWTEELLTGTASLLLLCGASCVQLTDPFLNVFRGIIPAVGGIDLSPMLGFFLLNFIRNLLVQYSHVM